MPATITAEERAMIDAKVAAGKVTRCATGAMATAMEYRWVQGKGLIATDREKAKAAFRHSVGSNFRNPNRLTPEQIKRRQDVAGLMDAGKMGIEIATMLGINVQTVYSDAKAMGRKFPRVMNAPQPSSKVAARRAKIAAAVKEGMNSAMIAEKLGIPQRTIWNDVRAMKLKLPRSYHLRKPNNPEGPKPCPKVAARRAKIPGLIARGMNGPDIARHLGVHVSAIRHDAKHLGISIPRRPRNVEMKEAA